MNKKVVLAYSGGLDTSIILKWLANQEYEVNLYSSVAAVPPMEKSLQGVNTLTNAMFLDIGSKFGSSLNF